MTSAVTDSKDTYETPDAAYPGLARRIPTLYFYLRMVGTVYSASRKAGKGVYTPEEWIKSSLEIIAHLEKAGCHFLVDGKKNFIDLDSPCVFAGNHMSTLETFALASIIRPHRPVTFVVKDSLVRYPLFGRVMVSVNPIVISRKNPRQDFKTVMEQGGQALAQGMSVIIFPQSVRTHTIDPAKFNSIGIKLARKADVPIVPLALKTDAWDIGWPVKEFGRIRPTRDIHFSFGHPLRIEGRGRDEHQAVINFISGKLAQWKKEVTIRHS
ncbi:MAG: lysophospholipid acyltransferase family protein [Desulfonatronovibrio sp.]